MLSFGYRCTTEEYVQMEVFQITTQSTHKQNKYINSYKKIDTQNNVYMYR